MTIDEARPLLTQYADGLLEPQQAAEVERVLAESPDLQAELKQLKEENELLEEALAPLRSSQSARMKLSDAMVNVHRQAQTMAESLPERGWRIFRLAFCFAALVGATVLVQFNPPNPDTIGQNGIYLLVIASMFGIGMIFLLWGGILAKVESKITSVGQRVLNKPSALGILLVQVFGAVVILGALALYGWMV
ncbi:MAG: hypothetical protein WCT04_22730 [Planctomycetota bacterium]